MGGRAVGDPSQHWDHGDKLRIHDAVAACRRLGMESVVHPDIRERQGRPDDRQKADPRRRWTSPTMKRRKISMPHKVRLLAMNC